MPEFSHLADGTDPAAWDAWRDALPRERPWRDAGGLVVLAAHPDDESLGAGGLIAAAAAAGVPVVLVSATWGEASHPDSPSHTPDDLRRRRRAELADALAALAPGARHVELELPDGALSEHHAELVAALESLVAPDTLVASPWSGDGHPDHEAAALAAEEVATAVGATLLEYPVWAWHWADPAATPAEGFVAVDLDEAAARAKAAALACHRSQHEALSPGRGDEPILSARFLRHFSRPDEVFRRVEPRDPVSAMEEVHEEEDPWGVDDRFYEARKRALTLACLPRERYRRGLEVGCSVGALAEELAPRCDELLAVDLSRRAVEAARDRLASLPGVRVERMRVPHEWPDGELDLVVVSESGYYLTSAELDALVARVDGSLTADGVVVLCHWRHPIEHWPLDGADVHARFAAAPGLAVLVRHEEPDLLLDVLQRPGQPSPAQAEGLV